MGKNSKIFDEISEAAELEPGDAKKAWRLLSKSIGDSELPTWVKDYVRTSAAVVAEFNLEDGDQSTLAQMLGFYREKNVRPGGNYDLDDIFEWFTDRMMADLKIGKKINVSRTAREYREEKRLFNSSPDGIRKAYEKARNRHAKQRQADAELERLLSERSR